MENCDLIRIVNKVAVTGQKLTPEESVFLVEQIIAESRKILARRVCEEAPDIDSTHALSARALEGYCGFAQCIAAYGLKDIGISSIPFSSHTLKYQKLPHVSLVLPLQTTAGEKYFLLDPTYIQFEDVIDHQIEALGRLMQQGYLELTPESARDYTNSFTHAENFKHPEEALHFMKNLSPSSMNYWFSPERIGQHKILLSERAIPAP